MFRNQKMRLGSANLNGANLQNALLIDTRLNNVDLSDANVEGAFVSADLNGTVFSNTTCPESSNSDTDPGCGL